MRPVVAEPETTTLEEGGFGPRFPTVCPRCGSLPVTSYKPIADHGKWTILCTQGHQIWELDKGEVSQIEPDATAKILLERAKTHGDFTDHARITSKLKGVIVEEVTARYVRGQPALSLEMRESLDMICHKIGRILAGKSDTSDHWDDIAGYARLVADRCR